MAGKRLEKIRLYEDRLADRLALENKEKLFSVHTHWEDKNAEREQLSVNMHMCSC